MDPTILIVDDQESVRDMMLTFLGRQAYRVLAAESAPAALELLAREPVDVIITDERMPGMTGTELLARTRRLYPDTIRMVLTGHADLEAAIRAINEGGIYRFFTKPCKLGRSFRDDPPEPWKNGPWSAKIAAWPLWSSASTPPSTPSKPSAPGSSASNATMTGP